jgi:predicted dinucleotide-binding enzyme
MRIAVLGTGIVGRTLAARLAGLSHEVAIGTRDPGQTRARTDPDAMGNPPFAAWHTEHAEVTLLPYPEAAAGAELVINATAGTGSLQALRDAGVANVEGKIIADVANPLDFSRGFPPTLDPVNTESLGEQIQRAFPSARVVKTLNTMNCLVMVEPSRVPGDHAVFLCGNDGDAKKTVSELLASFGWPPAAVTDLGDIRGARGTEMVLPLWLRLAQNLGFADFNIAIRRA